MHTRQLEGTRLRIAQRLAEEWRMAQMRFMQIDAEVQEFGQMCGRDLEPDFDGEIKLQTDAQGTIYLVFIDKESDSGGEMPGRNEGPVPGGRTADADTGPGGEV